MQRTPEIDALFAAALPERLPWTGRPTPETLQTLPNAPAVYLLEDEAGAPVQLATSQALRRLLTTRLTSPPEQRPGRADLAEITRAVRWRLLATAFEGRWWYYRLARVVHPREYWRLISFGPAYFLHAELDCPIPEIRVTERVWMSAGEYVGPWPTQKSAQEALEGLWDLFDLCRYPEQVRRTPHGTRCAYAEMSRCDAPCDGTAPLAAFVTRCRAAWTFASDSVTVSDWIGVARERMRGASLQQAFELAAQIKHQLRFAQHWQTHWRDVVRPAHLLVDLFALPVSRRKAWKLFLFDRGLLHDGPVLAERKVGSAAAAWMELTRAAPLVEACEDTQRMEQTWLYAHLLFSREAERLVRIELAGDGPVPGLAETLQARVEARRAEIAAAPEDEALPPNSVE